MNGVSDYSSVYDAFQKCASRFGDNAFLRAPPGNTASALPEGITYTYAETSARVTELIPNYAARGLRKGERVALVFDSRLEVYLHLLSDARIGRPQNNEWRFRLFERLRRVSEMRFTIWRQRVLASAARKHRECLAGRHHLYLCGDQCARH